jgi:hypothetical protein
MFKFIWDNDGEYHDLFNPQHNEVVITLPRQHADLEDLTEAFEQFLKGCGYELGDRHLEFVSEMLDKEPPESCGCGGMCQDCDCPKDDVEAISDPNDNRDQLTKELQELLQKLQAGLIRDNNSGLTKRSEDVIQQMNDLANLLHRYGYGRNEETAITSGDFTYTTNTALLNKKEIPPTPTPSHGSPLYKESKESHLKARQLQDEE